MLRSWVVLWFSFLPITTKFNKGLPPCRFSSSALILIACRAFPEERAGVGTAEGSSPFDPLDGVSGRLDVGSAAGVAVAFSGLPPRRTEAVTTPFSPVLRRECEVKFLFFSATLQIISGCSSSKCKAVTPVLHCFMRTICVCVQMRVRYLGTSKPMVCFLPETVMRATLGTTSESTLLWDVSLLLAEGHRGTKLNNYTQTKAIMSHSDHNMWSIMSFVPISNVTFSSPTCFSIYIYILI